MTDRTTDRPRRKSPVVPIVVAVVALVVAAALALPGMLGNAGAGKEAPDPAPPRSAEATDPQESSSTDALWAKLIRRKEGDPMAIGDVDAPVVMISYSEFQCPFCGQFARETEPELIEKFVEDDTLRIEWRDFPYLGPESTTAAHAARAAAAQGKFRAYHDALFADQKPPNSGQITEEHLVGVAKKVGLDVERFRRDLTSEATKEAVAADFEEGQSIGVTGTPAFLVNGEPIMGAQPTPVFVEAVEKAAAAAR